MILERPIELVGPEHDTNVPTRQIMDFVQKVLKKRGRDSYTNVIDRDESDESDLIRQTMSPLSASNEKYVFDLDDVRRLKSETLCIFFIPGLLDTFFSACVMDSGIGLGGICDLQDALRISRRALVFSPRHAFDLQMMGARNVHIVRFPALRAPHEILEQDTIVIIVHPSGEQLLAEVDRAISRHYPELNVIIRTEMELEAARPMWTGCLHIHVGSSRNAAFGSRIVDSLSARRSVIQVAVPTNNPLPERDAQITHLRSGIIVQLPSLVPSAIERILSDPAAVAIFQRNADRLVDAFNQEAEDRIWEALA